MQLAALTIPNKHQQRPPRRTRAGHACGEGTVPAETRVVQKQRGNSHNAGAASRPRDRPTGEPAA